MKKKIIISLLVVSAVFFGCHNNNYRPQVAAHRGASGYLPEHTLEAKAMAFTMAPDFIEQDVVMTKDNALVVLHDPTLETTTDVAKKFPDRIHEDGRFYAIDFTLEEIKTLTVTERFDPKTGKAIFEKRFPLNSGIVFRVPTLKEELELIKGLNKSTGKEIGIYVEIKEPVFHKKRGKDILTSTIEMLEEYGYNREGAKAILQIFDYESVKEAKEKGWKADLAMLVVPNGQEFTDDKEIHTWLATEEGIKEVSKYATIYAPWMSMLAVPDKKGGYRISNLADLARKYGMKVHTWTHRVDSPIEGFKNSEEVLNVAFKEIKIDGIFTDFPDVVVDYLKRNNMR